MVRIILFLLLSISVLTISCDDCINCEPFTQEPNLKVVFYNGIDSTNKIISIDSINQLDAKLFRHFSDTTNEFKFPLDMQNDSSRFDIVYHEIDSVVNYQHNYLSVYYDRKFVNRDDNYIIVECDISNYYADFDQYVLKCKDSINVECISNEAFLKVYN